MIEGRCCSFFVLLILLSTSLQQFQLFCLCMVSHAVPLVHVLYSLIHVFSLPDTSLKLFPLKVLREYNHVHPHDDEEGKIFANSRV